MLQQIKRQLVAHPWTENLQYFDTIDSTNTYAKSLASRGAVHGTVILAGCQTGGRGRLGRNFSSPKDMGIYLSLILRPDCKPEQLMHLTCATAVSTCRAISCCTDIKPSIKWTNDLVVGKRKLGGILTELSINSGTGKIDWVVIGIGINCCQKEDDFPAEIRDMACSLRIGPDDRCIVAAQLISSLFTMDQMLLTGKDSIMDEYRSLCVSVGQEISLLRGDSVRYGKALSVDDDGALIVRFLDGTVESVASGEVSIRGMYGYL